MSCAGRRRNDRNSGATAADLWGSFHPERLCQYVPHKAAYCCALIDVDSVETCKECGTAVALIEIKHESEQRRVWRCTEQLSRDAGLPAYMVVIHGQEPPLGFTVTNTAGAERRLDEAGMAEWVFKLRTEHAGYCRYSLLRQALEEFHTPGADAA